MAETGRLQVRPQASCFVTVKGQLEKMAEDIIPPQDDWWMCLADVIRPFLPIRTECEKLLRFLQQFMERVQTDIILGMATGSQRCIDVDTKWKPLSLSIENWERFVLSLGLEIERPDFAVDFDMISILTTPRLQDTEVQYVLTAIEALIDMDFSILTRMVGLSKAEVHQLWCLVMNLSRDEDLRHLCSSSENQEFRNLWGKYQDILAMIGFVEMGKGSQAYIAYNKTDLTSNNYQSLRGFLHGVLENPVDESFV